MELQGLNGAGSTLTLNDRTHPEERQCEADRRTDGRDVRQAIGGSRHAPLLAGRVERDRRLKLVLDLRRAANEETPIMD
jgi:hypothetical protein